MTIPQRKAARELTQAVTRAGTRELATPWNYDAQDVLVSTKH